MPRIDIVRSTPIQKTARVVQCSGIFDIPPTDKSESSWALDWELPESWNLGLIVGPSGSGKTTLLRELFLEPPQVAWSDNRSILDDFPAAMSIKEIVELLSSVGFSSPPSWLRPYRALSNGEQFRVSLARVLAEKSDPTIFDEFTSVVDRTVARIASAAFQKTVRRYNRQAVVASCHYDILEWLEPDWVFEPHLNRMQRGRLWRRPEINLKIHRIHHSAWRMFRQHHYLSSNHNNAAVCFAAFWNDTPVAFSSWLALASGSVSGKREHRTVTLPDFQGVGIGNRMSEFCAALWRSLGYRAFSTTSHPAMIRHRAKSPLWNMHRAPNLGARGGRAWAEHHINQSVAVDRLTAGFEYVGPAIPSRDTATRILSCQLHI